MEPPLFKRIDKPKPPLITPSASPPPILAHFHRLSESSPPSKRQRIGSTPLRTSNEVSFVSNSRPPSPIDVQKEREASKLRLLDVWSGLAERYTRRLDEDDIVDLRTLDITTDNGVLRKARKLEFGSMAAPPTDYTTADEGSDTAEEDEEDEYDLDELDAFANVDDYGLKGGGHSELDAGGIVVPPVAPLNPADAADLREFMEAERMRKDLYGSENGDDDEDEHSIFDVYEGNHETGPPVSSRHLGEDTSEFTDEENQVEEEDEEDEEDEEEIVQANERYSVPVIPAELASEDELDNWNVDETNIVYPVAKNEGLDRSDSDIEIIEPPVITTNFKPRKTSAQSGPPQGSEKKIRSQSTSPLKRPNQLYTPPQSSSSILSTTPERQPCARQPTKSSLTSVPNTSKQVPVHSPSKGHYEIQPKVADNLHSSNFESTKEAPVRRLDLSKVQRSRKVSPEKPIRQSSIPSSPESTPRTFKSKPFVLLTPRKVSSPQKVATSPQSDWRRPEVVTEVERVGLQKSTPSKVSNGKGKAKERANAPAKASKVMSEVVQNYSSPSKHRNQPSDDPSISNDESEDRKTAFSRPHIINEDDNDSFFSASSTQKKVSTPRSGFPSDSSSDIIHDNVNLVGNPRFNPPSPELSPRKRKRAISDARAQGSVDDPELQIARHENSIRRRHTSGQASTSRLPLPVDDDVIQQSYPKKRSSSKRRSSSESTSDSGSDSNGSRCSSLSASELPDRYHRKRSHSRPRTQPTPSHYPYSHHNAPYHVPHPPQHAYAPIPDPRAQFIITQAMQQLSALVGATWTQPHQYIDGAMPHTPSHRHQSSRPFHTYSTPTHHNLSQPYYDPSLSHATLPPDSPDFEYSPEKSGSSRRKSLVRRSRSRGRKVSFKVEEESVSGEEIGVYSSPSKIPSSRHGSRKEPQGPSTYDERPIKFKAKGERREETPNLEYVSDYAVESNTVDEPSGCSTTIDSPMRESRKSSNSGSRYEKHESRRKRLDS